MKIVFDSSSIHQGRRGSITGVIYFDFHRGQQFPAAGWNDFVVILAGWWLTALDEAVNKEIEVKLRFMDGPYWVIVVPEGNGFLRIRCIEDRSNAGAVFETGVALGDLRAEISEFASSVVRACSGSNIRSPDLDDLTRRLKT